MPVFTARSLLCEYCLLSLRFSLISANVSSEMGLLSDRKLLDFGMALSTAVLIADTFWKSEGLGFPFGQQMVAKVRFGCKLDCQGFVIGYDVKIAIPIFFIYN